MITYYLHFIPQLAQDPLFWVVALFLAIALWAEFA